MAETDTIHLYAKRSGYTPTSLPGLLLFTSLSLAPGDMKVGYSPFHNYIFLFHSQISNSIDMLYFMTNYVAVNDFNKNKFIVVPAISYFCKPCWFWNHKELKLSR